MAGEWFLDKRKVCQKCNATALCPKVANSTLFIFVCIVYRVLNPGGRAVAISAWPYLEAVVAERLTKC